MKVTRARSAALMWNVGRHAPILPSGSGRREEARTSGGNHEALSTVAGHAFGPAHSSGEAPVMGVERRCRTVLVSSFGQPKIFREGSSGRVEVEGRS